jgi:hypothetical protein
MRSAGRRVERSTLLASAIVGTAELRIVVSSDSMRNATATSHGNNRIPDVCGGGVGDPGITGGAHVGPGLIRSSRDVKIRANSPRSSQHQRSSQRAESVSTLRRALYG